MSKKLFVGGLKWATDDHGLRQAFEQFGEVTDTVVITGHATGRSRGWICDIRKPEDATLRSSK